MTMLVRFVGDTPESEPVETGRGSRWWPGEVRVVDDAIGLALVAAHEGWEACRESDTSGALTADEAKALRALVSGDGIFRPAASRFAILGDSLAGYCFSAVTITSATRSAGVVTVSATAHGLQTGGSYAHYGANEDSFNVSGVTVTRVDANTFSYPAAGADGSATGSMFGADLQKLSQRGFLSWARLAANSRINVGYVGVQGGATAATIGSKYVAPAIASGSTNAIVMAGVNNAAGSQTAAQIAAEIISSLLDPLAAAGMRVFVMAILPFASAHASFATATPKIPVINEALRRYCMGKGSMVWVDAWSALVDPVAATAGNTLSGVMDSSNLHTSPKGAALVGARLGAAIAAQPIPAVDLCMRATIDSFGVNALSNNLLDAGLMQGTGGTVSAPVMGSAPTGWTVSTSGTITAAAASLQSRSDGIGQDLQVVVQPGTANAQILCNTQTGQLLGRVVGGAWYQIAMEVSASGVSASNCSNVTAWLGLNIDGAAHALGLINGFSSDTANSADIAANTLFLSLPFWIPAGTITAPLLYFTARFSAASASSLTLKAGCVALRKLT